MLKIGTDPEFFLYDTKTRQYVSAHGMIPGDKKNPYKVDCGAVQIDGTAVEFNIDPVETAEDFVHNVKTVLGTLRKMVPDQYRFAYTPYVLYSIKEFERIPAESKELGCDPDYNAYQLIHNVVPKSIGRYRTGSGHIHVGWTEDADTSKDSDHFIDCAILSQQMERFFRSIEIKWDLDNNIRRQYYGNNAAFRPKKYGCEYRGLSNAWLAHEELWPNIFEWSKRVFELTIEGREIFPIYAYRMLDIRKFLSYYGAKGF